MGPSANGQRRRFWYDGMGSRNAAAEGGGMELTESFKAFAFCLLTGLVFWYTIGWSASFGEYCKKLNRDPKKVLRFCACGFWGLALVFLPALVADMQQRDVPWMGYLTIGLFLVWLAAVCILWKKLKLR